MVVYEAAIVAWCRYKSVGESGLCSDFIESLGESENDSKETWQLLQGLNTTSHEHVSSDDDVCYCVEATDSDCRVTSNVEDGHDDIRVYVRH